MRTSRLFPAGAAGLTLLLAACGVNPGEFKARDSEGCHDKVVPPKGYYDALMAENVMGEFVKIATVGNEVVGIAFRKTRVSMTTKVGNDHFKAGGDERLNVSPPNSLCFWVPMNEKKRIPTDTFTHIGQLDATR